MMRGRRLMMIMTMILLLPAKIVRSILTIITMITTIKNGRSLVINDQWR
jgi:hypothetical protein